MINYERLIFTGESNASHYSDDDIEMVSVYQIKNLAVYLHIDMATDKVITIEFDYADQPELLEKDIPRDTAEHVFEWLRSEGVIYGEL